MNRLEFLTSLRNSLQKGGLPKSEIEDACNYYEEIFFDAGQHNEEQTAESLGNPEELARKILIDSGLHPDGKPVFQMEEASKPGEYNSTQPYGNAEAYQQRRRNNMIIKLVILAVTSPIWVSALVTAFGIAITIVAVVFSLLFAVGAIGIAFVVRGIMALFETPPIGICLLGAGFIALGIFGIIFMPICKGFCRCAISIFSGIVNLVRKFLGIGRVNVNG